jgi:hypothetical protein
MGAGNSTPEEDSKIFQYVDEAALPPQVVTEIQSLPPAQKTQLQRQLRAQNAQFNRQTASIVQQAVKQNKQKPESPHVYELPENQQQALQNVSNPLVKHEAEAKISQVAVKHQDSVNKIISTAIKHKPKGKATKATGATSGRKSKSTTATTICKEWVANKKISRTEPTNPITNRKIHYRKPTYKTLNKICKSKRKVCADPNVSAKTHKPYKETSAKLKLLKRFCQPDE